MATANWKPPTRPSEWAARLTNQSSATGTATALTSQVYTASNKRRCTKSCNKPPIGAIRNQKQQWKRSPSAVFLLVRLATASWVSNNSACLLAFSMSSIAGSRKPVQALFHTGILMPTMRPAANLGIGSCPRQDESNTLLHPISEAQSDAGNAHACTLYSQ